MAITSTGHYTSDYGQQQFLHEVKNYVDERVGPRPQQVAYPAWILNQTEAFTIPLRTARDLWGARFGDQWIDGKEAGAEEFYKYVLVRLRAAGQLEEITGNYRLKEI